MCEEHTHVLKLRKEKERRCTAVQAAGYHSFDEFPGLCYLVLLPDGFVKIGYSNSEKLLQQRLKSLGRKYGAPVVPLLILSGGFVREAALHDRFDAYRVPGVGERFAYSPEIASFVAENLTVIGGSRC